MVAEERKQVLEMLAAGKISVEEATRLLGKGRTLRVRVVEDGKQKVNINVPFGLAKLFLKLAGKEALNPHSAPRLRGVEGFLAK